MLRAVLRSSLPVVVLSGALGACGPEAAPLAEAEQATSHSIVGGTVSSNAQDATVLLATSTELCSGSLIAPNLVLTARHCVATPGDGQECVSYGPTIDPSTMQVFLGVNANPDVHPESAPVANAKRITVPQTSNMCSFDVALVELDRPVTGAKLAELRFTPLAPNEPTTAVGYGVDGRDQNLSQRMQRSTTVLGVGPTTIAYTTQAGLTVRYNAPQGDIVTGESTCFGDSGGPLLDAQGRVVGVTSRGVPDLFAQDREDHGNSCIDEPSVYAGVRFHEQIIRDAAKAAGFELPASASSTSADPSSSADPPTTKKKSATSGDDDDDDDSTSTPKTKKKSTSTAAPVASAAACSATPGSGAPADSWLGAAAVAIVLALRKRRAARRPA